MIRLQNKLTDYPFSRRERFYNVLGLIILSVAGVTALIAYGLGPLFSGKPWQLVSPWLHVISAITGALLVWLGSGHAIKQEGAAMDTSLKRFWPYRVLRWIVTKVFGIVWFVITVIFFAWIRQTPSSSPGAYDQRERNADDIWDGHPKHYYDNDPPKPFS